jgi:hypothetical protein
MRYIQPQITGTFDAKVSILGGKGAMPIESNSVQLTNGAAYEADE